MHTMRDTRDGWQLRAACRDEDPNRMQPEVASQAEVDAAMAHCYGCPVWEQCEDLALSQAHTYGIHAGAWWGDPPRDPAADHCSWCGDAMDSERSTASYCSSRCRVAAHRARHAVCA